jgi:hypothetical protein
MNTPQLRATTGSTMQSEGRTITAALARLAATDVDPARIADQAMATWLHIDVALCPIIGKGGVAALHKRSLYLTRAAHPWLVTVQTATPVDFTGLQAALALQSSTEAAAAHGALLQTFHDLLTSLVGASLTERLLRPVWDQLTGGDAAQDTTP